MNLIYNLISTTYNIDVDPSCKYFVGTSNITVAVPIDICYVQYDTDINSYYSAIYECEDSNNLRFSNYSNNKCSGTPDFTITVGIGESEDGTTIDEVYCENSRTESCPVWIETDYYEETDTNCDNSIIFSEKGALVEGYCYSIDGNSYILNCMNSTFDFWFNDDCSGTIDGQSPLDEVDDECEPTDIGYYELDYYYCSHATTNNYKFNLSLFGCLSFVIVVTNFVL